MREVRSVRPEDLAAMGELHETPDHLVRVQAIEPKVMRWLLAGEYNAHGSHLGRRLVPQGWDLIKRNLKGTGFAWFEGERIASNRVGFGLLD